MAKFLLSIHVLAAILLIGPVTIAASLFPRHARQALTDGPGRQTAEGAVRLLHRICRVYAVAGISVPALGIGTAQVMGVMGSAWLIASTALTAVAAVLLGIAVLGTQNHVITWLDGHGGLGKLDASERSDGLDRSEGPERLDRARRSDGPGRTHGSGRSDGSGSPDGSGRPDGSGTPGEGSATADSLVARLPRLSMITGLFALTWLIVVVLMIVRPGSTTGA